MGDPNLTKMPSDQERRTPPWLFQLIEKEIVKKKFQLDAFASPQNALCKKFYTEKDNALVKPWKGPTFGNPPFKLFGAAIRKAFEEAVEREIVTCLVGPSGCSQSWFQNFARVGTVYAPTSRIAFYDSKTGKPTKGGLRDSMIYVFGPGFWNERADDWVFKMERLDVAQAIVRVAA